MTTRRASRRLVFIASLCTALTLSGVAWAQSSTDLTQIVNQGLTGPLKVLSLLTILSLLPAIVLTMTSFTRAIIVLAFVRTGIGSMQTPPTQVIVGIALFLTMFTMAPVTSKIVTDAYNPYVAGQITEEVAFDRAVTPIRSFMPANPRRTCALL